MPQNKIHLYPKNDIQQTPKDFYSLLDSVFHFDFDPCPIDPQFDGLKTEWGNINWVNPPFSDVSSWVKKGLEEKKKGKVSVFLIPTRTNTLYWFSYIFPNLDEILFLRNGLRFSEHKNPLPIPLCIVIFDGRPNKTPYRVNLLEAARGSDYSFVAAGIYGAAENA